MSGLSAAPTGQAADPGHEYVLLSSHLLFVVKPVALLPQETSVFRKGRKNGDSVITLGMGNVRYQPFPPFS